MDNSDQSQKICREIGLFRQATHYIVQILSPMNSILLLLLLWRTIFRNSADQITKKCISLFTWLGRRKLSRCLTGWFIVITCVK